MHLNQQVILPLSFYQTSHEGRLYSLPKLQKSRRVTVSRPVCLGLNRWTCKYAPFDTLINTRRSTC